MQEIEACRSCLDAVALKPLSSNTAGIEHINWPHPPQASIVTHSVLYSGYSGLFSYGGNFRIVEHHSKLELYEYLQKSDMSSTHALGMLHTYLAFVEPACCMVYFGDRHILDIGVGRVQDKCD